MNNKSVERTLLVALFMISINLSFSNNISISNISLSNKNTVANTVYVQFNLRWENSWKTNNSSQNWDAAWIFIKFRVNGGIWQHATLGTMNSQHIIPSIAIINTSDDGKGVFLYRADYGSGNFSLSNVQLKWLYGIDGMADDVSNLEIKVFGIEMVYVNQGEFYVGDGSSIGRFWNASGVDYNPALIGINPIILKCDNTDYDDQQIEGAGIYIDGVKGIDIDGVSTIDNPDFPTGYSPFYSMKYEITNEQFAQFLNTLTRTQQNNRCFSDISGSIIESPFPINGTGQISNRNCVRYINPSGGTTEPVVFFCDLNNNALPDEANDGNNVTMNWLGWADGAAYADWAGLRPMTELEFEKACRGAEMPVADEYAWHTTDIFGEYNTSYTFNNLGEATEFPLNPGTGIFANCAYEYTVGHKYDYGDTLINHPNRLDGPLRAGIFATSSSIRINSGASYYGVMELSGNQAERCVTIGVIEGRNFRGTHGDGLLNMKGNATNLDWPGIIASQSGDGVIIPLGSGFRGGDWNDPVFRLRVSNRDIAAEDIYIYSDEIRGNPGSGFRCVRTAK